MAVRPTAGHAGAARLPGHRALEGDRRQRGRNILLHMAAMQPARIEAMVVVSATMYYPEQSRKIMAAVPAPEEQPQSE